MSIRGVSRAIILGSLVWSAPGVAGERAHKDHHQAHWGYQEAAAWGRLSPAFAACAAGSHQSPIDLAAPIDAKLSPLQFAYAGKVTGVVNNGHALQLVFDGDNRLISGGKTYRLLQAHFHTPSEHTLAGKSYPAEIHFVHRADDGELAVVGVLFEAGKDASAFAPALANMPAAGASRPLVDGPAAAALAPASAAYYLYRGSLTTPPCSEGVRWHVVAAPQTLSAAELKALGGLFGGPTNRPVQPLNDRFLLRAE